MLEEIDAVHPDGNPATDDGSQAFRLARAQQRVEVIVFNSAGISSARGVERVVRNQQAKVKLLRTT